jgi:uncharacterized protein YggE
VADFCLADARNGGVCRGALAVACKDAQLMAEAAARSLGLKVRRVIKIMSAGDFQPQQGGRVASMASFQASVTPTAPIKPGELTVNATVTVTYELE